VARGVASPELYTNNRIEADAQLKRRLRAMRVVKTIISLWILAAGLRSSRTYAVDPTGSPPTNPRPTSRIPFTELARAI
jgi:hypothetical protein